MLDKRIKSAIRINEISPRTTSLELEDPEKAKIASGIAYRFSFFGTADYDQLILKLD